MFKKFRKFAIAAALVSTSFVAVPAAHAENVGCMLNNGCFYEIDKDNTASGHWVCSSDIVYMLCRDMD